MLNVYSVSVIILDTGTILVNKIHKTLCYSKTLSQYTKERYFTINKNIRMYGLLEVDEVRDCVLLFSYQLKHQVCRYVILQLQGELCTVWIWIIIKKNITNLQNGSLMANSENYFMNNLMLLLALTWKLKYNAALKKAYSLTMLLEMAKVAPGKNASCQITWLESEDSVKHLWLCGVWISHIDNLII